MHHKIKIVANAHESSLDNLLLQDSELSCPLYYTHKCMSPTYLGPPHTAT